MASFLQDANTICSEKILDSIAYPMYMIFKIQHDQINSRTDSANKTLYHFKQSMANMKLWNSSVIHDFCEKLVIKFPELDQVFPLVNEMLSTDCKTLNESKGDDKSSSKYVPKEYSNDSLLHKFITMCSESFIGHPEWFANDPESSEYQICMNNAKIAMKNDDIIGKTIRTLIDVKVSQDSSSESDYSSDSTIHDENEVVPIDTVDYMGEEDGSGSESEESETTEKLVNLSTGAVEDVVHSDEQNQSTFQSMLATHVNSGVIQRRDVHESNVVNVPDISIPVSDEVSRNIPMKPTEIFHGQETVLVSTSDVKSGDGSGYDIASGSDAGSDSEVESDGSDSEVESGSGSGSEVESGSGSEVESDDGSGSEVESGSGSGSGSEVESGSGSGSEVESDDGSGSDVESGSGSEVESDESGSGSDESGSEVESDESGSGSDESGSGSEESGSGSDDESGSEVESEDGSGSEENESGSEDESGSESDDSSISDIDSDIIDFICDDNDEDSENESDRKQDTISIPVDLMKQIFEANKKNN